MSVRQVHRQVTEHGTEVSLHETDDPHEYVEVTLSGVDAHPDFIYLSLTPEEARVFADALLSSSQRVNDRIPHTNN